MTPRPAQRARQPEPQATALRRTRARARRLAALAGMLGAIGGLVGLRAAITPPPAKALGSTGLTTRVHSTPASSSASPSRRSPGAAPSGGGGPRRVVGTAYDVGYGTVQVRVTLNGRRITDVTPLSLPSGGHSRDISGYAAPTLRQEALAAQSAHIDTVSGASYTSAGYAQSLQSALDKAHR